jgi:hypothetical protein
MARPRILEHRLVVAATPAMVFAGLPAFTGHARPAAAAPMLVALLDAIGRADKPVIPALAEAKQFKRLRASGASVDDLLASTGRTIVEYSKATPSIDAVANIRDAQEITNDRLWWVSLTGLSYSLSQCGTVSKC